MSWNYRVVRHAQGYLALHEVYYDDAGTPRARTSEPCGFMSDEQEGLDGLIESLGHALNDARKWDVLDDSVFPEADEAVVS